MPYQTSAIVIGAGIGGLAAASAALKHFDRVIIVEKDDLRGKKIASETIAETKKRRSGVPQYVEPHILLAGGSKALETLVPGFSKELCSRGAHPYDAGHGLFVYDFGGPFQRGIDAGVEIISGSRRLINETLQDLVLEQGKERLEVRDKTIVSGLFWERPRSEPESYNVTNRVRGVQGVVLSTGEELKADVVIVCNGRRSQLPSWLKETKLQVPSQLKVDCKMNYASRWMRLPADFDPEKEFYSAVVNGRPALARGGTALVLEDNLLQISMTGFEGERAPLDHEGWMEYAASLPDQTLYKLAQRCEPVSPISRFASTPNTSYQYHTMKLPEGLVIMGDAFVALNPVYGQGMSVAAQQAIALDQMLAKVLKKKSGWTSRVHTMRAIGPKLHKILQQKVDLAWDMSTSEDMRWPGVVVEGVAKPPVMLYNYLDAIMLSCQQSKKVWRQLLRVSQFVAPPSGMFSPRMVAYATKNMIFGRKKMAIKKKKTDAKPSTPAKAGAVATPAPVEVTTSNSAPAVLTVSSPPPVAASITVPPVVRTTSRPRTPSTISSMERTETERKYSDGGKDVDLISAEKPEVKGAVAA